LTKNLCKTHNVALVAVSHKMLKIVHTLIKNNFIPRRIKNTFRLEHDKKKMIKNKKIPIPPFDKNTVASG
jgi:hypothetical protein